MLVFALSAAGILLTEGLTLALIAVLGTKLIGTGSAEQY